MENHSDDPRIKELLDTLFLEVPGAVWMGFVDAAMYLERKSEIRTETSTIPKSKRQGEKHRGRYPKPIRKIDLAKTTYPTRWPRRKFNLKSRNRVRDLLLGSVDNIESREGLTFIWKVIHSWLLTASKEYLVYDRTESEWEVHDRNADRLTVVTEIYYNIVRSWELNY